MIELSDVLRGVLYALPWVLLPMGVVMRQRVSRSLDDYTEAEVANSGDSPERVSIILPARNEAAHIADCIRTLRATDWKNVEIIIVNDHSIDATRALATEATNGDSRVTIMDAPDLPEGWFGKQWACHSGAQRATGELLLFTDADTRHAPDLLPRLVHARYMRDADLMSVAGVQEMNSFWELAIQPVVFAILLARYGGTTQLENAKHSVDVIANGQCLMMTRTAYDTVGGHYTVRGTVAEDLMLAQGAHAMGLRVSLMLGYRQLSTHMYSGLRAVIKGWMKNVYAGGRLSAPGGKVGRFIFPATLIGAPLLIALPYVVLAICALFAVSGHRVSTALAVWSAVSSLGLHWFFSTLNAIAKSAGWRVLLVPVGALAFACICAMAVVRGRSVEWKGRSYRVA